jgi:hypothetical protein
VVGHEQAAFRRGIFPRQRGELCRKLGLVEISVDEGKIVDMPLTVPGNEGAHQMPDIVERGTRRCLNDVGAMGGHGATTVRTGKVGFSLGPKGPGTLLLIGGSDLR